MPDEKKPFHNPFASLANLAGVPRPAPPPAPEPVTRAVVRLERAGRGGKEVTLVEHLDLSPGQKMEWLKALKAALGCGGHLQGDALLLQGDQRERLRPLLAARGVRKITVA